MIPNMQTQVSKSDLVRKVTLPKILDENLAEFLGIIVGDGHVGHYPEKDKYGRVKFIRRDVKIACNKSEEEYINHVMQLSCRLFSIELKRMQDSAPNCIVLRMHSKGIVHFLHEVCGIPLNKKTDIAAIPRIVKIARKEVKCAFLRGLADTDFAVTFKKKTKRGHSYPVIKGSFKSRVLVQDLAELFSELGFTYCCTYNESGGYDKRIGRYITRHSIYLNGKENFERWMHLVNFSNAKFQRKVDKWRCDGVCPPGYK
jgi:intein/homing endonuclease